MKALASAMRAEILDTVDALGPCSIAEIAEQLGKPPYAFYYHIEKLEDVGLLLRVGSRKGKRREEALFDTPGHPMRFDDRCADDQAIEGRRRGLQALLRVAHRDVEDNLRADRDLGAGLRRNTYGGRIKGWLTDDELEEVNRSFEHILSILGRPKSSAKARLHAMTFVITRLDAKTRSKDRARQKNDHESDREDDSQ